VTPCWREADSNCRSLSPPKTLSLLQQCAHVRDRVGIAFQAVRILFGLRFNLQPAAVRTVEVEGLAIPPFDNFGHGDAMVPEPLVGGGADPLARVGNVKNNDPSLIAPYFSSSSYEDRQPG
jgi:hypothetical protein